MSRKRDRSFDLLLLEGRPHLGGRIGSYIDKTTGKEIDTGQHLFLSCYSATLELLDRLGTRSGLVFYDRLVFPLWDRDRGLHALDIPGSGSSPPPPEDFSNMEGFPFQNVWPS